MQTGLFGHPARDYSQPSLRRTRGSGLGWVVLGKIRSQLPNEKFLNEIEEWKAKADLATDMVREFPELQGIMGGIYAREEGLPEEVWKAIYFHYLPNMLEGKRLTYLGCSRPSPVPPNC